MVVHYYSGALPPVLPGTTPPKPGLLRVTAAAVRSRWKFWQTAGAVRQLCGADPAPLGIGTITLADGTCVQGFYARPKRCKARKTSRTSGGWRAYLASR